MKRLLGWLFGAMIAGASSNAGAAVAYFNDDGISETNLGVNATGELWWAQGFTEQPGGGVITSIEIAFGSLAFPASVPPNGTPVTLFVYDDPTNDLDPTDAILLTSVATTIQNLDTDIFNSVPILPTAISGDFFVAALTIIESGFPMSLDQTSSAAASWAAFGTIDPNDVAGTADFLLLLDDAGFPGNLLLRATGTATGTVPEPTALLLLGLGLAGLGFARRRLN